MTSIPQDLSPEMDQLCTLCQQPATQACQHCELVLYCSARCRSLNANWHGRHCDSPLRDATWRPDWEIENREPTFFSHHIGLEYDPIYLWGNMPAIDILRLSQNEGVSDQDLHLLFGASGDLRNLFRTIAELPDLYDGKVTIVINDKNTNVICRNALMLLMLCSPHHESRILDAVFHLWYSAFMTEDHMELIRSLRSQVEKYYYIAQGDSPTTTPMGPWRYGNCKIDLSLTKEHWRTMLSYCNEIGGLSCEAAQELRRAKLDVGYAHQIRSDIRQRHLLLHYPQYRVSLQQFYEDGIVLPFGQSRSEHVIPNPTLFFAHDWHLIRLETPLSGWNLTSVANTRAGLATNDIFGQLYCYVKALFRKVRARLANLTCHLRIYNLDARHLNQLGCRYDRIECSNISDVSYLGIRETVGELGPMLKAPSENIHATLITLSMGGLLKTLDVLHQTDRIKVGTLVSEADSAAAIYLSSRPEVKKVADYLARGFVLDFEEMVDLFKLLFGYRETALESGTKLKRQYTVVENYPCRPKKNAEEEGAMEEFWHLLASLNNGFEAYFEWQRRGEDELMGSDDQAGCRGQTRRRTF